MTLSADGPDCDDPDEYDEHEQWLVDNVPPHHF